jgi:hypothetical protein
MLLKILGLIDLIIGGILIFSLQFYFSFKLLFLMSILLITKSSLSMWRDFGSWVDTSAAFFILFSTLLPKNTVTMTLGVIFGILVAQKGIFSFLPTN